MSNAPIPTPLQFDTWEPSRGYSGPWETTKLTPCYVYFYRRDYDGDQRYSRRFTWREWWELISSGEIRVLTCTGRKNRAVVRVARQRLREMDAARRAEAEQLDKVTEVPAS